MDRRGVLAALAGSVPAVSLAGCTRSDDGTTGDGDEPPEDGTGSAADGADADDPAALIESADESLDEAITELGAALEAPEESTANEDVFRAIDTDPIDARIGAAETDLSAARDDATDEQRETIVALEGVAAALREFVGILSGVTDAADEFATARHHSNEQRWDEALAAIDASEALLEEADADAADARSTVEDLDADALEAGSHTDPGRIESELEAVTALLAAIEVILVGHRTLTEGMADFDAGLESFQSEEFGAAESAFSAASDRFDAAHSTLDEEVAALEPSYRRALEPLVCTADALGDAAAHYANGADAYAAGDADEGAESIERGIDAAARCEGEYAGGTVPG